MTHSVMTNVSFGAFIRRIALVSLLGAFGGVLSGACLYYLLHPGVQGVVSLIVVEGLCFVPLGACIGFSLSCSGESSRAEKLKMLIGGTVAGFVYGALAVFSVFGGLLGLLISGIVLAFVTANVLSSTRNGSRIAVVFGAIAVMLYAVMWIGDEPAKVVTKFLYPTFGMAMAKEQSIIWLSLIGYLLNAIVLATMGIGRKAGLDELP
jgi:hypothetical protein